MIVLDENILADQREVLKKRGLRVRQIGVDLGRKGQSDEDVLARLRQITKPTFFTRDRHFSRRQLCQTHYCLVWMRVKAVDVADYAWRFLRHKRFRTFAQRRGLVIRLFPKAIVVHRREGALKVLW